MLFGWRETTSGLPGPDRAHLPLREWHDQAHAPRHEGAAFPVGADHRADAAHSRLGAGCWACCLETWKRRAWCCRCPRTGFRPTAACSTMLPEETLRGMGVSDEAIKSKDWQKVGPERRRQAHQYAQERRFSFQQQYEVPVSGLGAFENAGNIVAARAPSSTSQRVASRLRSLHGRAHRLRPADRGRLPHGVSRPFADVLARRADATPAHVSRSWPERMAEGQSCLAYLGYSRGRSRRSRPAGRCQSRRSCPGFRPA